MRHTYAFGFGISLILLTHNSPAQTCPQAKAPASCQSFATFLSSHNLTPSDATKDVVIDRCVTVPPGDYAFKFVNVTDGGILFFEDPATAQTTTFNANAILVEQGGTVRAGAWCQPFGQHGGKLVFGLWGDDPTNQGKNENPQDKGISCKGGKGTNGCYADDRKDKACTVADPNNLTDPCNATPPADHSNDNAVFEGYGKMMSDPNLFGYKVLAVSYGGSLQLFGKKGVRPADFSDPAKPQAHCAVPQVSDENKIQPWANLSGNSWALLNADAADHQKDLTLDRSPDWDKGDKVVVATTDWSPGHSEIGIVDRNQGGGKMSLAADLGFPHNGHPFSVTPGSSGNPNTQVDLRGAVGLLTRSITIRSLGKTAADSFPAARDCGANNPDCYFGGHVVARQGFARFQLQGVELYQLGQGGRMGHYPIHFHLAKVTNYRPLPANLQSPKAPLGNAFVKDSSIWESNTRFITLHATHDVTLARNVGFLSVGHAFYLEDGTEIDNLLCQNLGVSARPSYQEYFQAQDPDSPTHRFIPPILEKAAGDPLPLRGGDSLFPTMFWIMNAYNEFVGNKAVGVHGFGPCYWLFNPQVSGPSVGMQWSRKDGHQTHSPLDYANFQGGNMQPPLKRFRGNSCSTATYGLTTQMDFQGVTPTGVFGATVVPNPYNLGADMLPMVKNNFYPKNFVPAGKTSDPVCAPSNSEVQNSDGCSTTIIDRFTTSFNWSEANFGSVWLRPGNFLFMNSAITDQLYGGLLFVTGGSPEQALPRNLMLTRNTVFAGTTRPPGDRFAARTGPDISPPAVKCDGAYCAGAKDGFLIYAGAFQPKRLISIYDGPFFSEGSVFQNTASFTCDPWAAGNGGCGIYKTTHQPLCGSTTNTHGADASCVVPAANNPPECGVAGDPKMLVIDAGIGWKQPNGFYYPPAFAFRKSNFAGDDERHNVFDQYRTYVQGVDPAGKNICMPLPKFGGLTPIDFTTILNDLDGTLNGVIPDPAKTKSKITNGLSRNFFYKAPHQVPECSSFGTDSSPFGYVSSLMTKLSAMPSQGNDAAVDPSWTDTHPLVPIYRQLKLNEPNEACTAVPNVCDGSSPGCQRGSFMLGASNGQAPALTVNHGVYYIDTSQKQSTNCISTLNLYQIPKFEQGLTYMLYQLYATDSTQVTYQVYVGENFVPARDGRWVRVDPHAGDTRMKVKASPVAPMGTLKYGTGDGLPAGILEVTLDNSRIAADFKFSAVADNVKCQPRDICSPQGGQCTVSGASPAMGRDSALEPGLLDDLKQVCQYWATRTTGQASDGVFLSDCPANGCIGFAFTLPQGFAAKSYTDSGAAGLAKTYPDSSPWNVSLKAVDGRCATGEVTRVVRP